MIRHFHFIRHGRKPGLPAARSAASTIAEEIGGLPDGHHTRATVHEIPESAESGNPRFPSSGDSASQTLTGVAATSALEQFAEALVNVTQSIIASIAAIESAVATQRTPTDAGTTRLVGDRSALEGSGGDDSQLRGHSGSLPAPQLSRGVHNGFATPATESDAERLAPSVSAADMDRRISDAGRQIAARAAEARNELSALLEQAVGAMESLADQSPGARFEDIKRRVALLEQRVNNDRAHARS